MMKKIYSIGIVVGLMIIVSLAVLMVQYSREKALEEHLGTTINVAHREAMALESELQKFSLLPNVLAETQYVHDALNHYSNETILTLNAKLLSLVSMTGVSYVYVIDMLGNTIASSNYADNQSFIGRSFEFRPYFKEAIENGSAIHFAKGEVTGKAGLFLSRRIEVNSQNIGVIVVKVEFDQIVKRWQQDSMLTLVVNANGIILFASDDNMDFSLIKPLEDELHQQIIQSNQFGTQPLKTSWLVLDQKYRAIDQQGKILQAGAWSVPILDWELLRVEHVGPTLKIAEKRALVLILSGGMALAIFGIYLSWKITRDKERAFSTAFLKREVSKRTQELVVSNEQLRTESAKREEINVRFRQAREELAQANRLGSIGAITASVAHEINQPLAAIKTFAQNTKKLVERKDEVRVHQNLEFIVELSGKISAISTELRRYARRDYKTIERVYLRKVLDGVELLVGDTIHSAGVHFVIVGENINKIAFFADRVRVEQILVNLIQNALEAMEIERDSMMKLTIETSNKFVTITLDDNGVGIDKDANEDVFTPFFTSKKNGLGIGLGIARDISADFGGTLEIVPSKLGGAAFQLRLPKA